LAVEILHFTALRITHNTETLSLVIVKKIKQFETQKPSSIQKLASSKRLIFQLSSSKIDHIHTFSMIDARFLTAILLSRLGMKAMLIISGSE
jgi:hypothetical protein